MVGLPGTRPEVESSGLTPPHREVGTERAVSQVCQDLALNAGFGANDLETLRPVLSNTVATHGYLNLSRFQ